MEIQCTQNLKKTWEKCRSTLLCIVLLALLRCSSKFSSALKLQKACWQVLYFFYKVRQTLERSKTTIQYLRMSKWWSFMHLICLSNKKKHCEREIHIGCFQAFLAVVWLKMNQNYLYWNEWHRSWTFHWDFAVQEVAWWQLRSCGSLNSTDNSSCLYVSTISPKSQRNDNSALLELRHRKSRVLIVQVLYLETVKQHIFIIHHIE